MESEELYNCLVVKLVVKYDHELFNFEISLICNASLSVRTSYCKGGGHMQL